MSLIKKQSLSDQLYEQIRLKIINLSYPMGSKLNVSELQDIYGVSSTPIREAINRLQIEGLVTYENNVGAKVITLAENDIREIQSLAIVLHSAAIRFSMKRGKHIEMAKAMKKYLDSFYKAKTDEDEVMSIFNIIGIFYLNCGNSRLDNNMKVIQGEQLLLRYLFLTYSKNDKSKDNYLEKIIEAVNNAETEKIIQTLTEEYDRATNILVQAIENNNIRG